MRLPRLALQGSQWRLFFCMELLFIFQAAFNNFKQAGWKFFRLPLIISTGRLKVFQLAFKYSQAGWKFFSLPLSISQAAWKRCRVGFQPTAKPQGFDYEFFRQPENVWFRFVLPTPNGVAVGLESHPTAVVVWCILCSNEIATPCVARLALTVVFVWSCCLFFKLPLIISNRQAESFSACL